MVKKGRGVRAPRPFLYREDVRQFGCGCPVRILIEEKMIAKRRHRRGTESERSVKQRVELMNKTG